MVIVLLGVVSSATNWIPKATVEPHACRRRDQSRKAEHGDVVIRVGRDAALDALGREAPGRLRLRPRDGRPDRGRSRRTLSARGPASGIVGKTIGGPWKVRVAEEYNAASGDANPNHGLRRSDVRSAVSNGPRQARPRRSGGAGKTPAIPGEFVCPDGTRCTRAGRSRQACTRGGWPTRTTRSTTLPVTPSPACPAVRSAAAWAMKSTCRWRT